jgi:cell division protein FtsZ
MGKAMMGTGEAGGDNRAIEAAEQAIANPLLDGVSMKGARGVIISITGGEDMRLMEVDEAASHIKELVDPDANIIWGSAFNPDLDGKIRVSVVATGIEADVSNMAPPMPAKVFTFPGASRNAAPEARKVNLTAQEPIAQAPAEAAAMSGTELDLGAAAASGDALELDTPAEGDGDELLLDTGSMVGGDEGGESFIEDDFASGPEAKAPGTRSWITGEETPAPAAKPAKGAGGGTLFERMSNIARGADKAQVEEEPAPRLRREPLDIPRFLGRQNNQ